MKLGVIDEPIISKDADKLDIRKHSDALVRFIQNAATPITIGVQGNGVVEKPPYSTQSNWNLSNAVKLNNLDKFLGKLSPGYP